MSDVNILSQMIKPSALVQCEEKYDKKYVVLIEPQALDSRATIRNLPEDALVIRVEAFRSSELIFNGSNGECKRSDFVIVSVEKKCILHIEMKRTKGDWADIVNQLIGSHCFIRYCQEIGSCFWKEKEFLNGYRSRFISIGHTSIPKRKTRITRESAVHDRPEQAMKVDWPHHLQFNQLAGLGS